MEYLAYGDLKSYMRKTFPESEARTIARQLVEAVGYLHTNRWAHRDLKPNNILVVLPGPVWWVKLADFGISKHVLETSTTSHSGFATLGFVAPEVLRIFPPNSRRRRRLPTPSPLDIWSVGEIVFRLLAKQPVFDGMGELSLYVRGDLAFPAAVLLHLGLGDEASSFVQACMMADPSRRPTARDLAGNAWLDVPEEPASCDEPSTPQMQTTNGTGLVAPASSHFGPPFPSSREDSTFSNSWTTKPIPETRHNRPQENSSSRVLPIRHAGDASLVANRASTPHPSGSLGSIGASMHATLAKLESVPPDRHTDLATVFHLIAYSECPLSKTEICHAAVAFGHRFVNETTFELQLASFDEIIDMIVATYHPLLSESEGKISMAAHKFKNSEPSILSHGDAEAIHRDLALMCIRYLIEWLPDHHSLASDARRANADGSRTLVSSSMRPHIGEFTCESAETGSTTLARGSSA